MEQPGGSEIERRSWPRRLLNRMEVDRAVFYAVAARGWQFVAGPVTMVLIAVYFTAELQGYFYTFGSLLALQWFLELGLHIVLVHLASHEWAKLGFGAGGELVGDQAALLRLASLTRRIIRWYAAVALAFVLAVGGIGPLFFGAADAGTVAWRLPWFAVVVLAGLSLWLLPLIALLEGCNQVVTVHRTRLIQAIGGNLVIWTAIPLGAELWSVVAVAGVKLLCEGWLVLVRYRRFFGQLASLPGRADLDWRVEVWPLQWRMSVQSLFGYFGFAFFTPVMFHYHGAAAAGRMGMSWTILLSLQAAALAWVQTRTPRFGMLVSRRDFAELDRIFFRLTGLSLAVIAMAGAGFWGAVLLLNVLQQPAAGTTALHPLIYVAADRLAERLLPPLPTAFFTLAVILLHVPLCQAIYVRAHKIDPFLWLSLLTNLMIGLLVWLLGSRWGPSGAGLGYLAVVALIALPGYTLIWTRCRRELH